MMNNFKTLGLALAAVLALGSMTASAAQAQLTFTGSIGGFHVPTFFRAFQSGGFEFRSTAGTQGVSCTGVSFTGQSETGKSKTITASALNNQKCSLWPGYTAHRSMNSCDYRYNLTKKINEHKYEGTTDIQCTTKGDVIDYQVTKAFPEEKQTKCTIKVEEQSGVGPIYYENITPMMGLKFVVIKANATNLKTITEASSGNGSDCNVPALGTHTTGTLTGKQNSTAFTKKSKSKPQFLAEHSRPSGFLRRFRGWRCPASELSCFLTTIWVGPYSRAREEAGVFRAAASATWGANSAR